jgi:hypothetical protein
MRLYWTFSSLPELGHLSPQQRKDLIRKTRATGVWIRLIAKASLWSFIASGLLSVILQSRGVSNLTLAACHVVAFAMVFVTAFQFQFIRQRSQLRLELMESVKGQRLPACLACGYDQSANITDRCPECGRLIRAPK